MTLKLVGTTRGRSSVRVPVTRASTTRWHRTNQSKTHGPRNSRPIRNVRPTWLARPPGHPQMHVATGSPWVRTPIRTGPARRRAPPQRGPTSHLPPSSHPTPSIQQPQTQSRGTPREGPRDAHFAAPRYPRGWGDGCSVCLGRKASTGRDASPRRPHTGQNQRPSFPTECASLCLEHLHVPLTFTAARNRNTARLTAFAGIRLTFASNRARRASVHPPDRPAAPDNRGSMAMADRAAASPVCV